MLVPNWNLKSRVLHSPAFSRVWAHYRRWQQQRDYVSRREHYSRVASDNGLVYRESDTVEAVRARMDGRGYSPRRRAIGHVHTFAFIPRIGWHAALYKDLRELGPVSEFDYAAHGYSWDEFWRRDRRASDRRHEMNSLALSALREAHARHPVDWVFVYASGLEIRYQFVQCVTSELGVPVVNMCLDDKNSWSGPPMDGQRTGQIEIAPHFDLAWTSARVACEWYLAEGGRPIYMPEGFDAGAYYPVSVKRDIPVSFVGACYGYRRSIVDFLRRCGVDVRTFGVGWNQASWVGNAAAVFNRSTINLGMGGVGYLEDVTNVKGRDFEIPGTGGGVYLTSFNSDLAQHFVVGEEVLCYGSRSEMLELVRYYLARPTEARAIADRARQRCLSEHRWLHRYRRICEALGILSEENRSVALLAKGSAIR